MATRTFEVIWPKKKSEEKAVKFLKTNILLLDSFQKHLP